MFGNFLKVAARSFLRQKFYSLLNLLGLSIGIASTILILLYVKDEVSFDRFHQDYEQIYRLNLSGNWAGEAQSFAATPPPLAGVLNTDVPEVESAVRIYRPGEQIVHYKNIVFAEPGILGVDSNFFDIFSFEMIEGNPRTALKSPFSILLTENIAKKYFGESRAIGKILTIGDGQQAFTVTGILANPPKNSHIEFDMLTPITAHPSVKQFSWSWIWLQLVTYVKLKEHSRPAEIDTKIPALVKKHGRKVIEYFSGQSYEAFEESGGRWTWVLQPLSDIRLHSQDVGNRLGSIGNIKTVQIFLAIAFFIILIACMNFMNLSTARFSKRAKEIGIRKAVGSQKSHLVLQFLAESMVFSLLALLLALGVVELSIGAFNNISGKQLDFQFIQNIETSGGILFLALLIGLMAGSYPAFYMSAIQPIAVLKGQLNAGPKSSKFRNALVLAQFSISIGLIICTLLIHEQLTFLQNKNWGFAKENIVVIPHTERLGQNETVFKQQLLAQSSIAGASFSSSVPTGDSFGDFYEPEASDVQNYMLGSIKGDYDFLATYGLKLAEGRNFSQDFPADVDGVLLNEAAVRHFGWAEPIGKTLIYPGNNHQKLTVVGVVEDFNFFSLFRNIDPFAIFLFASNTYTLPVNYLSVRIRSGQTREALAAISGQWQALAAGAPFEYSFLDSEIQAQFQAETQLQRVFAIFTGLAIFIACLGLVGLAAYSAARRTREIGVRKVLGASVSAIFLLISRQYLKLALFANLIAWPIAWYGMEHWLRDYAYRIEIGWQVFVLSAALALFIALATVSYQAIKAALTDPVTALRHE